MSRASLRTMQGVAAAVGAPLGWLLIELLRGIPPAQSLADDTALYLYLLAGTIIAFGTFGLLLGRKEDDLLELNSQLEDLAVTDPLTRLHNRRYFHDRMDEEFAGAVRTGHPLSLVIVDIDHFKRVNDEYGHLVGDAVLVSTAQALVSVTRRGETAARVGGEEFALLLPGSTSKAAQEVADRARQAITDARTPTGDGRIVRVFASAGVASTADIAAATPDDLYRAADEALYRAKEEGRNRTVIADPS